MHPNEETDCMKNVPDEILDESNGMQSEIKRLLTEVRKSATKVCENQLKAALYLWAN